MYELATTNSHSGTVPINFNNCPTVPPSLTGYRVKIITDYPTKMEQNTVCALLACIVAMKLMLPKELLLSKP